MPEQGHARGETSPVALRQPAPSCRGSEPWLSGVWVWPNPYPRLGGFPCPPSQSWAWWDGVSTRTRQELQGGTGSGCHKEGLWVARGGAGALPSPESPSRLKMCLLHAGCVSCLPSSCCISAQPFQLASAAVEDALPQCKSPLSVPVALPRDAGLGCPPTTTQPSWSWLGFYWRPGGSCLPGFHVQGA